MTLGALDTMNAVSNMMAGAKNNSPTQSLFSASYLSGINLSYTYSKSTQTFQTVATNVGINCGTLVIEAGNKIIFSNGVTISVLHFANLTAKEFWQLGAKLENSFENNSVSGSVGISLDGNLNFGAGVSHYDAHGTTYVNQTFTAGDGITIHVQTWGMQNANTMTNNLKAATNLLSMVSDTDKSVNQSFGGQINTNGNVSVQGGSERSNIINNPTSINVGHIDAETKELTLKGSQVIATNGTLKADHVKSESVDQFSRSDSIGLSTNISSDQAPSSGAFEKPITTTNVSLANKDYAATQNSTIFIPQGPGLEAKSVDGPLNTANASGLEIDKDEQYAFTLEVPDSEKSWQQVGDNLASVSKQLGSNNHVNADTPAYIQLADESVHDGSDDANSHYYNEGEEKQNLSLDEQEAIDRFIQNAQKEIYNVNLDTDINTNDPVYKHELSDATRNNNESKSDVSDVDYVVVAKSPNAKQHESNKEEAANDLIDRISQEANEGPNEPKSYLDHIPVQNKEEKVVIAALEGTALVGAAAATARFAPRLVQMGLFRSGHKLFENNVVESEQIASEVAPDASSENTLNDNEAAGAGAGAGTEEKVGPALKKSELLRMNGLDSNANNHINLLRLQRQFQLEQARSIFTIDGKLTEKAINSSKIIIPGNKLNKELTSLLLEKGGNILNWGKYRTPFLDSLSGRFEMHFYRNPVTGGVYYGRDYKAIFEHQGKWNPEPKPKFKYEP